MDEDVDPLKYWKQQQHIFPRLAKVALNILAIPGSAVSCERCFNIGRDMVGIRRHSLSNETMSALMFGHYMLKQSK
jgi:hypothetical protein